MPAALNAAAWTGGRSSAAGPGSLLPAESSGRKVRALRSWGPALRTALAQELQEMAGRWRAQWASDAGPDRTDADRAACTVETAGPGCEAWSWYQLLAPGEGGLWWSLRPEGDASPAVPRPFILAALCGETHSPVIADAQERLADLLADTAWESFCDDLLACFDQRRADTDGTLELRPARPASVAGIVRPWRGAVLASLPWYGTTLHLLVGGDLVERWASKRGTAAAPSGAARHGPISQSAPLTPLVQVLLERTLPMSVEFAPVDVTLGSLAKLRVGDVLCTRHALDAPLLVRSDSDDARGDLAPLGRAFLGRVGIDRAIELVPASSAK